VPLLPLFGHDAVRARIHAAVERGTLPASLLLHGPRGVGKQQLALWIGRLLLCSAAAPERPCGKCQHCKYATQGAHPDLHWYFPRPRLKDADASPDDVNADLAEGVAERVADGLYAPPSGSEAIYVFTVRAIVHSAVMSPALAKGKVYVVGDAERMVAQEGSDQAANAFLKLLEEPPANTNIILTSSEPGALLPTIRSRVVPLRVPPLAARETRAFIGHDAVAPRLKKSLGAMDAEDIVTLAQGAPGRLIGNESRTAARTAAEAIVVAAESGDAGKRARAAMLQGGAGARGAFSDTLDALTAALHERTRAAVARDDARRASSTSRAVEIVERAKEMASGNVNPQLITADLLRELAPLLR
jgi:DNA polymerase-3 subunit delta'